MARWEPDARGRLLRAALDLFAEHGYDATTTAQIAERAGLTKTTLFRLFADKREIVFQGQSTLVALVAEGIEKAPESASPKDLVRAGLVSVVSAHTEEHRANGRTLEPILAASEELRERWIFKRAAITAAFESSLTVRLGDPRRTGLLADLAVRAYYTGYDAWLVATDDAPLIDHVMRELVAHEKAAVGLAR